MSFMTSRTESGKVPATINQALWPIRNHISIFVRCLHLLNLDLLEGWPGITVQTFSTKTPQQNTQHRIKAVEWSLYRLFEIYNPSETRNVGKVFYSCVIY